MKKLNILLAICLVFFGTVLTGCFGNTESTPSQSKLSTPVITWDSVNERVYWNEVPNADKYEVVYCDTKYGDTVTTSYNNYLVLQDGSYSIKVKAISETSNYLNSDFGKKDFTIKQASGASYVEKEQIGTMLRIYLFELTGLPEFESITLYDTNNNFNLVLSRNNFTQSKADLDVLVGGHKVTMDNHDCYIYETELNDSMNLFLYAKFTSNSPFTKVRNFGSVTNK